MRKQYYFRPSSSGFFAWDVDRLIELSKDFKPQKIRLDSIDELDEVYCFNDRDNRATCRNVIEHARLIQEADLRYPIILSEAGLVMDGMHRVGKAVLKGMETIHAVQFNEDPEPDYIDVYPEELSY